VPATPHPPTFQLMLPRQKARDDMNQFGTFDWAIIIAFLIGNLVLGFATGRNVVTAQDYHIGTRTSPWWAIGISVIATYVSALSFLGGPAWAYGDGMKALIIHMNYPIVIFIVVAVFLPFFYNSGVASIYEYLERRFGKSSRSAMSLLFLVTQSITAGSILTATAFVISFATGFDTTVSILLMTGVVLVYTMIGGMNAVIWTDVFQGAILFIGAGVVLWRAVDAVSPMSEALKTLDAAGKLNALDWTPNFSVAPTVWAGVGAMTLFHITVYGANQMMVQRVLAAKSIGDAKKSYILMGYAAFFIYFLFFFIGALMFVYYQGKPFDEPNEIILIFAQSLAIPGLMGLLAAAILSASMSSLASAYNSLATVSMLDFYEKYVMKGGSEKHNLLLARGFTIFWGVVSIPIAFAFISSGGSILESLTRVGSYLVGAKLAMFGLGFFSKHANERGVLAGVVAGFIALIFASNGFSAIGWEKPNIAWPWFVVIGGGVNLVVGWIASVVLEGFKTEWHPQTIVGQRLMFARENRPVKVDGWYQLPGKIDPPLWGLVAFFFASMLFLAIFGGLGLNESGL
jgi:solute:Na+ symporter, SSS family